MLDTIAQRVPANTLRTPVLLDSTALMVRDRIKYEWKKVVQKVVHTMQENNILLSVSKKIKNIFFLQQDQFTNNNNKKTLKC